MRRAAHLHSHRSANLSAIEPPPPLTSKLEEEVVSRRAAGIAGGDASHASAGRGPMLQPSQHSKGHVGRLVPVILWVSKVACGASATPGGIAAEYERLVVEHQLSRLPFTSRRAGVS